MRSLFKDFFLKPGPKYSWRKALFILSFSIVFFIGGFEGLLFCFYLRQKSTNENTHPLQAIIQTGPQYNILQSVALAEILDLSEDDPKSLETFDLQVAKKKLLDSFVIRKVELKKIKPNLLYIDYEARNPIAFLEDFTNVAFDEEGIFFPYLPFFSCRDLPHVFLGGGFHHWGEKMDPVYVSLVKDIFTKIPPEEIKRVDLSKAAERSLGKKQIVLVLRSERTLRLSVENYAEELNRYLILEDKVLKHNAGLYLVDFRTPEVAYIEKI